MAFFHMFSISSRKLVQLFILLNLGIFVWVVKLNFPTSKNQVPISSNVTEVAVDLPGLEEIPSWYRHLLRRSSLPPIAGHRDGRKKFLTIGICSVYREQNYLISTLQSLINESVEEEKVETVVVIFIADTDMANKEKQLDSIRLNFGPQLDSGFFQVIVADPEIYPPFDFALHYRTFNDSVDRVIWRAKSVIDFAFLISYARDLSEYYLAIDDDLITTTGYITAVKDFIKAHGPKGWGAMKFTQTFSIGLLFRSENLPNLVSFLTLFYKEQPLDFLFQDFLKLQEGNKPILQWKSSLFQHIGVNSSLPNKLQKYKDSSFNAVKRQFPGNRNPPANITTTMTVMQDSVPDLAYHPVPGMFLGIVKPGDTYDIVFQKPLNLSRVVIITGNVGGSFQDALQDATLEVSPSFQGYDLNNNGSAVCKNFTRIADFYLGALHIWRDIDTQFTNATEALGSVQCLRVKVGGNQITTLSKVAFREIQIFS